MTTVDPTPAPAVHLRELVFGAAYAGAIRAAARLGVADALGDEPAAPEDLAASVKTEPHTLKRLLRALSAHGIFEERADGRFAHTAMSRLLQEDAPGSLRYIALWCTEPWTWDAWPRLDEAVRSGKHVFHDLYGKEFFDYLNNDAPESAHVFDKAMTTSSRQSAKDIADFLDLDGISSVADIGGGQGLVLTALMEKHPRLHGSLLDLPSVVANADPRLRDGGSLAGRARVLGGDCRQKIPVEADLYLIKNILEWDDDSTRRTLGNVIKAARPGARVVVIENLVDDSLSMKFTTAMDLLLLLNVGGGKHTMRSMTERMAQAGLQVGEVRPVNGFLHAIDSTVPA